ncbi:MAG: DUF5711 family protein [Lachnospiraceae bacterium]|nr:DUF5711 family protein [Lachnospiraceae bacterium]
MGKDNRTEEEEVKTAFQPRSVIILVLFLVILAVIVLYQQANRKYSGYRDVRSADVVLTENSQAMRLGDSVIIYSSDGMRCMNSGGKTVWDISFQIQQACIDVSGSYAAIADYGESTIYVVNEEGLQGEITTGYELRTLCVSQQGTVGAVLDDGDVYWVYIYSVDGTEIAHARTTMEQSGYPIDLALSPNGKLLAISYLYLDVGTVSSTVAFYNLGEVGQNYADKYVSGYNYDEIVARIEFLSNSVAVAVSDGSIIFYEGSEKPQVTQMNLVNEDISAVYWGDDCVGLVFDSAGSDGKYLLRLYNTGGSKILETSFDLEYSDIQIDSGVITIYNDADCLVLTTDGKERYSGNLGGTVLFMSPTSRKYRYNVLLEDEFKVVELE